VRAARVGERCAYVGNAAQTLHPVAGQGLNLGLRDAWDLAQVLHDAEDPGAAHVLRRYAGMRRLDAGATVRATDFLAGAFLGTDPVARAMRGIGLTALDICLPARRFFARRMIFGASALP
jgi:2-octaprenyl-6-methoxyphenol hydroxylase